MLPIVYDYDLDETTCIVYSIHLPFWEHQIQDFWVYLTDEERHKSQQFVNFELTNKYIICHGFLRYLLSSYSNISPHDIDYMYKHGEKPYFANYPNLFFNMSHSDDMACYVLALKQDVGIDVEKHDKSLNIKEVEYFSLTPLEQFYLTTLPCEKRIQAFYDLWTLKEALVKSIGKGLLHPLNTVEVIHNDFSFKRNIDMPGGKLNILSFQVLEDFSAAIAYEKEDCIIKHINMVIDNKCSIIGL